MIFFSEQPGFNINKKYHIEVDVDNTAMKIDQDDIDTNDSLRAVKWMIDILPNPRINETAPAIFFAVHNQNIDVLKWFFEHGAKIVNTADGSSLFNCAVRIKSDPKWLNLFLNYGIHETDMFGQNAFHWAAYQNRSTAVFDWLYEHEIDINLENEDEETPFYIAVRFNPHAEILSWFLNQKNFDDFPIDFYFYVALMYNKEPKILQWFLNNGVDIELIDEEGNTWLHDAAQNSEHFENVKWLIDQGVDINIKNNKGKTAQYYANKRKDWKNKGIF